MFFSVGMQRGSNENTNGLLRRRSSGSLEGGNRVFGLVEYFKYCCELRNV